MPLSLFIFGRVAGWRTVKKLRIRDLLLLTCLVHMEISVAISLSLFYLRFFIHISFVFDKTKHANGKLYGELQQILQYNFKERD